MLQKTVIAAFLCLCLFGCGKTNVLQWAKPSDKTDNIEMARKYIDEGDYDKAASYLKNPSSKEEKILYAECLMGQADVDPYTIITALTDETVTDNYIIRLETLINDSDNRAKIIEAADIFIQNKPSKTSDIIIGTLCTMVAHVAFVKNSFDPNNVGLLAIATSCNNYTGTTTISDGTNTYNVDIGANVYSEYKSMGNPFYYIGQSAQLLSNIKSIDPSIKDAITSFNATAETVSENFNTTYAVDIGGGVIVPINLNAYQCFPWILAKPLFLM